MSGLPLPQVPELDREEAQARAQAAVAAVVDPEIPVLTIADMGVLREVRVGEDGKVEAIITPTYSGCPAMDMIALEIVLALEKAGFPGARVSRVLSPAWTTDWMSEAGKAKLEDFGIAPPPPGSGKRALIERDHVPRCPRCKSEDTERISEFGSTACKALWRCRTCREPFDYFKCI